MPLYLHACIDCRYRFIGYLEKIDSYPMGCPKCDGDCVRSDKARTIKEIDRGGVDRHGPARYMMPPNCS